MEAKEYFNNSVLEFGVRMPVAKLFIPTPGTVGLMLYLAKVYHFVSKKYSQKEQDFTEKLRGTHPTALGQNPHIFTK